MNKKTRQNVYVCSQLKDNRNLNQINDEKNKPIPIIPNTNRENVKVFEEKHKGWLLLNLSSMYLGFILGVIFLVYGFFMEG